MPKALSGSKDQKSNTKRTERKTTQSREISVIGMHTHTQRKAKEYTTRSDRNEVKNAARRDGQWKVDGIGNARKRAIYGRNQRHDTKYILRECECRKKKSAS